MGKGKKSSRPSEEIVVSQGIAMEEGDAKLLVAAAATAPEFTPSGGLTSFEANELLLKYGRNELEDVSTPKVSLVGNPFCASCTNPSHPLPAKSNIVAHFSSAALGPNANHDLDRRYH